MSADRLETTLWPVQDTVLLLLIILASSSVKLTRFWTDSLLLLRTLRAAGGTVQNQCYFSVAAATTAAWKGDEWRKGKEVKLFMGEGPLGRGC